MFSGILTALNASTNSSSDFAEFVAAFLKSVRARAAVVLAEHECVRDPIETRPRGVGTQLTRHTEYYNMNLMLLRGSEAVTTRAIGKRKPKCMESESYQYTAGNGIISSLPVLQL